ncbi:hypothetical protein [Acinetobacter radioresistens]|uniref:hypothetical protein n=1 Tax=Acinetobacter radioresistens TaxID=40216 RepID=UPI002004DE1E|nr:hypothetical protein [Acinetobacter radioresistens]MCK4108902.1 hypothetical protein [Acinetobacter radioresistens]
MQESINPITSKVLNGRKRMIRRMVLTTTTAIPALVYAKVILNKITEGDGASAPWGGLGVMAEDDEHDFDYVEKGFAMVLLDQFTGAALNKGLMAVDSADPSFMANIEPFNHDEDIFKQYENTTGWYPQSGDVMCLLISSDYALWVENVGQQGQTLVADFGTKYLLNKRDDLAYLKLFEKRPEPPINP